MTAEEQANVLETVGMMETLGWLKINEEDRDDGVYITFMHPKEKQKAKEQTIESEIPAAQ